MSNISFHVRRALALAAAGTFILGFTAPATAGEGVTATENAAQRDAVGTPQAKEKKYCFVFESTGSRMRSKVCKTKAEWEAQGQEINLK